MYLLNEKGMLSEDITLQPQRFAEFIAIVKADRVNKQTGKVVFEALFMGGADFDIEKYIKENNLEQVDDSEAIREAVKAVFAANPTPVEQYKAGQTKVVGFFVGQVMKQMRGKAKPDTVNRVVGEELAKL